MSDWTNKLPTPPELVRALDEAADFAHKKLGCMVVLIAVQENGKCATTVVGTPSAGPLKEMAKDPAAMLANVALVMHIQDGIAQGAVKS